jgi:hypothetical protein
MTLSERRQLLATILSTATNLSLREDGPYLWATPEEYRHSTKRLVAFAQALVEEIERQTAAKDAV